MNPGTRLGPYEIVSAIGAGGMGEVYRARDTRLDRTVALKVLPERLASDPDFRARFEREARVISQLQHPHICTLHDVGRHDDVEYLVLEYLEGETLDQRLARGPMTLHAALDVGVQIADALDKAHGAGIVHRDLKPGNVMLTQSGQGRSSESRAKLLDFGLARNTVASSLADGQTALNRNEVTVAAPVTARGTIVGTFQYMAPEQLQGLEADARADIWAFGCVLYEMLTGRRAFDADSQASLIGAILKDDPPAPSTLHALPAALDRIVSTCLAKDPEDRWQSARDLARELRWAQSAQTASAPLVESRPATRKARTTWIAATFVIAAASAGMAWWLARPGPVAPAPTIRAVLLLVAGDALRQVGGTNPYHRIAISPDGRWLAYVASSPQARLVLRNIQSGEIQTVAESSEIGEPSFSADSRFLAFLSGVGGADRPDAPGLRTSIRKISVTGGAPATIVEGVSSMKGLAWGDDDAIYYTPAPGAGLWRVSSAGGTPEQLTTPDRSQGEKTHRRPFVLPGSRAVLFVVGTSRMDSFDEGRIEILSLADRSRRRLVDGGTAPHYVETGHLVYARGRKLVAVAFDPERLETSGAPFTVAENVADANASGVSHHSISSNGTLVFEAAGASGSRASLVAVDRAGKGTVLAEAPYTTFAGQVSPDGTQVLVDPDGATQQLMLLDLAQGGSQRLTFEWDNATPVWTADGRHIVFRSNRDSGARNLYLLAADGSGVPQRLTTSTYEQVPTSVSGRLLAFDEESAETRTDIRVMSLDDRVSRMLVETPADDAGGQFSPDGKWIAYQSNQSGAWEIYVESIPSTGSRRQISRGGGVQPVWQRDGRELIYRQGSRLMSVRLTTSPVLQAAAPVALFTLPEGDQLLDVMPDGRLLVLRRDEPSVTTSLQLVINWFAELKARMR